MQTAGHSPGGAVYYAARANSAFMDAHRLLADLCQKAIRAHASSRGKKAASLFEAMSACGLLATAKEAQGSCCYCRVVARLGLLLVDDLAEIYASHFVQITNLVHSNLDKKAEK